MKMYRKIALLLILMTTLLPIAADDLFLADTSIFYGEEEFLERLEKSSRDEPLGLVLSGGSARAFAHIGVLQYLEERGIIPDFIVSNSMGSIVGLLYSAGLSPDQIYEIVAGTDIGELFNLKLPFGGGLLDVSGFSDLVHRYLGDLRLEELEIPIIVVCEDLKTKRPIRIAEGDYYEILEASYALPVYFNPVPWRDHVLLDGGITNLLHLDTAYAYSDDIVVSSTFYENPDLSLTNPLTILNVSIDIGKRRSGVVDLITYDPTLIRCDVEDFSFMDFPRLDELYEAGYTSAKAAEESLSIYEKTQVPDRITVFRESFESKQDLVMAEIDGFGFIPGTNHHGMVNMTVTPFGRPLDETPLHDDLAITAGYWYKGPYYEGSLSTGIAIETHASVDVSPLLMADHTFYITPKVRAALEGRIEFRPDMTCDEELLSLGIDAILLQEEAVRLMARTGGMLRLDDGFSPDYSRISAGLQGIHKDLGYLYGGYFFEDTDTHGAFMELNGSVSILSPIELRLRGIGRMPFDQADTVTFFPRDAYRLNKPETDVPYIAGSSAELLFVPQDYDVKMAELLVVDTLSIGGYGEVIYTDSLEWGVGAVCSADVSLIGIESSTLSLYAGYSSVTNGLAIGYAMGAELDL